MLKGIIFDMDGVLINSEPFHYRIWKETLRRRGIQIEYEVYKACIGSTVGFLMKLLHEHYGVSLQDTALVEEMREIKEEMMAKEGYPPLIPYVKELLEKLCGSGYQLAVASSSPYAYIEKVTRYWDIQKYFTCLVSGEFVEHPKPAPDVFLKAAGEMGLSPEECLVVEDSENGCKAAQNAGITCVAYFNPDSGKQDLGSAYMIVEGYEEIDGAFMEKVYCHSRHLPATVCETSRLLIREMKKEDIPRLMEICGQETSRDACEGVAKPLTEELEGFDAYRTYMYELCDMGYWCVLKKDTGELIGRAGIEPKLWNHKMTVVELGYIIDERYRKNGYAFEACRGIIAEAVKRGAYYLHCRIKSSNTASINLAKKLGFELIDYKLEDDGENMEVWRYTCGQRENPVQYP